MTNDFGADFAGDITDVFSSGTDITAQATYYVTLYDDTGSELNGSLQNGRVSLGNADISRTNTAFENGVEVDFGENTSGGTITVQEFGIKAADDTDANTTVYFKADITDAPQDFTDGTRVFFPSGELNVDILD